MNGPARCHRRAPTSLLPLILLTLIACAPGRAAADPAGEADADAPAVVIIAMGRAGERLEVTWRLPEPVTEFAFTGFEAERRSRQTDWAIPSGHWTFDGETLRRADGATFEHFSFIVSPSTTLRYPGYAVAARIGEAGWVIHAGALAQRRDTPFELRFTGLAAEDRIAGDGWLGHGAQVIASERGFVYVGPADQIHDRGLRLILPDTAEGAALFDSFEHRLAAAFETLTGRLGPLDGPPPTVSLSYDRDAERRGVKGSVDGGFIALAVTGHPPEDFAALAAGGLAYLVNHEAFHLWNGREAHRGGAPAPAWLSEGGAEYAAILLGAPETRADALEARVNNCLIAIGSQSLETARAAARGRMPYACGALAMLFADVAVRAAGSGDILTVWRDMIASAGAPGAYDGADFRRVAAALAGSEAALRIDAVLDGWESSETSAHLAFLRGAGIELTAFDPEAGEVRDAGLSISAVRAFAGPACPGGYALSARADHLVLSAGEGCTAGLTGDLEIAGLNGVDLIARPRAAFETARHACLAGESVLLTGLAGEPLASLPCPDVVATHPGLFTLVDPGALAAPL